MSSMLPLIQLMPPSIAMLAHRVETPRRPVQVSTNSIYIAGTLSAPAVATDDFFNIPAPYPALKSSKGRVTAEVVDCGLAAAPCSNATGKICLLQVRDQQRGAVRVRVRACACVWCSRCRAGGDSHQCARTVAATLQRGLVAFNVKVNNCLAGGGVAAIMIAQDSAPECASAIIDLVVPTSGACSVGPWQGLWLSNACTS